MTKMRSVLALESNSDVFVFAAAFEMPEDSLSTNFDLTSLTSADLTISTLKRKPLSIISSTSFSHSESSNPSSLLQEVSSIHMTTRGPTEFLERFSDLKISEKQQKEKTANSTLRIFNISTKKNSISIESEHELPFIMPDILIKNVRGTPFPP
jgi:hypothetical protein